MLLDLTIQEPSSQGLATEYEKVRFSRRVESTAKCYLVACTQRIEWSAVAAGYVVTLSSRFR